jgi:hypothetical protein
MYKNGIYPIEEVSSKLTIFYQKLSEKYGLSKISFQNDWPPLTREREKRLQNPEAIRKAVMFLKTFKYSNIQDAIETAEKELKEAELK